LAVARRFSYSLKMGDHALAWSRGELRGSDALLLLLVNAADLARRGLSSMASSLKTRS
jgi:hypothetical protein